MRWHRGLKMSGGFVVCFEAEETDEMNLTIQELLSYTDEERAKWERWFAEHGDGPLAFSPDNAAHASVGALVLHMFGPELQYTEFMRGETALTDYAETAFDKAEALFAFGRRSREALRAWSAGASAEDWERRLEPQEGVSVSARKIATHVLLHEIRHWAQVALVVRQHGLAPPGNHDLLFSTALD
jgi:uncharacterized damage-inducible protein DinB